MIADCRGCLAKACTIAVRYSAVRLQGGGKKLETKILDYPTQQHRLFPLVATCYAFHFTGLRMMALLDTLRKDVPKGDTTGLGPAHATLCGLKAWCTTVCSDGIEECRRSASHHAIYGHSLRLCVRTCLCTSVHPSAVHLCSILALSSHQRNIFLERAEDAWKGA